jgi:hypothetical protein
MTDQEQESEALNELKEIKIYIKGMSISLTILLMIVAIVNIHMAIIASIIASK